VGLMSSRRAARDLNASACGVFTTHDPRLTTILSTIDHRPSTIETMNRRHRSRLTTSSRSIAHRPLTTDFSCMTKALLFASWAFVAACSNAAPKVAVSSKSPGLDLQSAPAQKGAAPGTIPATFACNDSLQLFAIFNVDSAGHSSVALAINDDRLHLPQLLSASGARYGDSSAVFWNKGDSATFAWRGVEWKCGESKK
jgi:membrane-bound inhibitor of C-type lysozyme